MKALIAFYTAGVPGDRRFVPAQWLNTVVIRPGRSFLEATKYRIIVDEQGVRLGAIEIDPRYVGPTLSLGSLRAHVVLPDGDTGPEAIYEGRGQYRDPITGRPIKRKHDELAFLPYSGQDVYRRVRERARARDAGLPDPTSPYDLDRALRVLNRAETINIDHPLGRDIMNLRDIYFASHPAPAPLVLPPLWVAVDTAPTPRQPWLDERLMALARGDDVLEVELSPFTSGVVLGVAEDAESGDTGVLVGNPDGEAGELNLIVPRGAEVLVREGQHLNASRRVIRLLPRRNWTCAAQIRGELPSLARYAEAAIVDDATCVHPQLGTLCRIGMFDALPAGATVYAENLQIERGLGRVQVLDVGPDALCGCDGVVAFDLCHHRWCRPDEVRGEFTLHTAGAGRLVA